MIKYLNMKSVYVFILFILFLLPVNIYASVSNGTIDIDNKNALICHSVDCTTPTPGIINFSPTGVIPVTISDVQGIDGIAWGDKIGFINLDPTGDEGLIIDPSTGIITGKAWSQVSGWINFSVTGQTVKINQDGEFEGWAWTGGPYGGWIKFDCSTVGACVKTDWRPLSVRAVESSSVSPQGTPISSLGGSSVSNDICLNIVGFQSVLPNGYIKDQGGLCLLDIDYCKNIEGIQLTIPNDYVLNNSGQCILLTEDNKNEYLPNIEKMTSSMTETLIDYCSNLYGLQSQLPEGFYLYNKECLPLEIDYCPNLLGQQYEIPKDMKISDTGECIKMTKEEMNDYASSKIKNIKNKNKLLAYSFIPDIFKVLVDLPFSKGKYKVDIVSVSFTVLIFVFILSLISRFTKKKNK